MIIQFTAKLKPVAYSRPRFGKFKQVFDASPYSDFKAALRVIASQAMCNLKAKPLKNKIAIQLDFFKNNRKVTSRNWGDIDNLCKAVLDSLNKICFDDDSQIVQLTASKNFSHEEKIFISVKELDHGQ